VTFDWDTVYTEREAWIRDHVPTKRRRGRGPSVPRAKKLLSYPAVQKFCGGKGLTRSRYERCLCLNHKSRKRALGLRRC